MNLLRSILVEGVRLYSPQDLFSLLEASDQCEPVCYKLPEDCFDRQWGMLTFEGVLSVVFGTDTPSATFMRKAVLLNMSCVQKYGLRLVATNDVFFPRYDCCVFIATEDGFVKLPYVPILNAANSIYREAIDRSIHRPGLRLQAVSSPL